MSRINTNRSAIKLSGSSLIVAGVLTFVLNLTFLPLLESIDLEANRIISPYFLWRQISSLIVAILLLISILGLYLYTIERRRDLFNLFSTIILIIGNSLLLSHEWSQVFIIRSIYLKTPGTMELLDSASEVNLMDIGSITIFSIFVLSWLLYSILILKYKMINRQIPILIMVGLFITPILSAILPTYMAGIIGNGILGLGWFLLGRVLYLSN